jgi:hypothetical protein
MSMVQRGKVAKFKHLIGIDDLPGVDARDGVHADWRDLPQALSSELSGLRLFYDQMYPLETGVGVAYWVWKRREKKVGLDLFVCGDPAGARKRLVDVATDTTTVESQMVPALEKVGELATEYKAHSGDDLLWVYRNVCGYIWNEGGGPKVLPAARRIQSFLAAHTVPNVASYIPKVAGIDLSPSTIRSGDTFQVKLRFAEHVDPKKLTIDVRPGSWPPLEPIDQDGSTFTVKAIKAGRAELEIIALDPISLLSAKAGVVIDVLPSP